eukprot:10619669-Alexandrium_andersonii.AAC.1
MGDYEQPAVGMKSCFDYRTWEAGQGWHARGWCVVRKAEMHVSGDDVLIPYLQMGVEAAHKMLLSMAESRLKPDALTCNAAVSACEEGLQGQAAPEPLRPMA